MNVALNFQSSKMLSFVRVPQPSRIVLKFSCVDNLHGVGWGEQHHVFRVNCP